MIIYDNEMNKIYPHLIPAAPVESQAYHLDKLTEVEAFLAAFVRVVGLSVGISLSETSLVLPLLQQSSGGNLPEVLM